MKLILKVLSIFILITNYCYAGAWNLTHASRANCVNNESISWDLRKSRDLAVTSVHYKVDGNFNGWGNRPKHNVTTGAMYNVIRAAAVHYGESYPYSKKYFVLGHHWERINRYRSVYRKTSATDCRLSEGWW